MYRYYQGKTQNHYRWSCANPLKLLCCIYILRNCIFSCELKKMSCRVPLIIDVEMNNFQVRRVPFNVKQRCIYCNSTFHPPVTLWIFNALIAPFSHCRQWLPPAEPTPLGEGGHCLRRARQHWRLIIKDEEVQLLENCICSQQGTLPFISTDTGKWSHKREIMHFRNVAL